jgi:lipopolysaccharide/colanic/teichoic acid biosynthesis glycosyltransferase
MQPELKRLASEKDIADAIVAHSQRRSRARTGERTSLTSYTCWCISMNLVFGLLGLVLLLLLLPILALCMYIDSPGPIFYTQERLGYQGSLFRMYKLRSMHVDMERKKPLALTTRHDPRITGLGRFLRMTHLDELPQVINILRGEMSLVGPRPELPDIAVNIGRQLPRYHQRLCVKPGLTGLAQVMYHYGDTLKDEEIKLAYDLHYIEQQSWQLDVKTLLKTLREVFFGHGR